MMIGSEKTHWTISEDEHGLCFSTTGSDEYKIYLEQLEEEILLTTVTVTRFFHGKNSTY